MVDLSRDDVPLLVTIEASKAFQAQIVRLCCPGCEDDLTTSGPNQVSNLFTCVLASLLGLPAKRVRPGVRIAEALRHVRQHLVQHSKQPGETGTNKHG